jgi:hypothetical protein
MARDFSLKSCEKLGLEARFLRAERRRRGGRIALWTRSPSEARIHRDDYEVVIAVDRGLVANTARRDF